MGDEGFEVDEILGDVLLSFGFELGVVSADESPEEEGFDSLVAFEFLGGDEIREFSELAGETFFGGLLAGQGMLGGLQPCLDESRKREKGLEERIDVAAVSDVDEAWRLDVFVERVHHSFVLEGSGEFQVEIHLQGHFVDALLRFSENLRVEAQLNESSSDVSDSRLVVAGIAVRACPPEAVAGIQSPNLHADRVSRLSEVAEGMPVAPGAAELRPTAPAGPASHAEPKIRSQVAAPALFHTLWRRSCYFIHPDLP